MSNIFFIPVNKFKVEAHTYFHPGNRERYGSAGHTTWKVKRQVVLAGIPMYLWYGWDNDYSFNFPCYMPKYNKFIWEDDVFQKMVKPFKRNNYSNVKQVFFKGKR